MVGFFSGTDAGNANLTVMDGAGVFAYGINTIQVSAGTLIPNGNGKCTIQTGGGGGGGSIGGTISAGQVAFGTALDTIGGDPQFTYNSTTNVLTVSGTVAADTVRLGGATNTPLAANTTGDIIAMGLGANGLLTYASGVLTALTQGFTINDTTTSKAIGNGSELRVASNTAIGQAVSSLGANTAQLEVVLKNTGVVAGSYNPSNITVDAQGRITAATTGNIGMSSWKIRGDTGTTQTINDNDTVIVVGGTGIDTVGGATDQITVNLNAELNDLTDVVITGTPTDLQVLAYNGSEWVNSWNEINMIEVRNDEGSTIPAGAPLYSRGEIGGSNRILVGIADANDSAKMPCIGIAYEEMNTTTTQDNYGVVSGVYNTNLTGFTGLNDGDTVYVKNWTGTPTAASDVLTTTRPTDGSEEVQNVGIILKTNGTVIQGLLVSAIGRSNDIPNAVITANSADADYVYIDDGNVWKKITPANLGISSGANPTQTIGASTVNGTATTFMRSDAAPALETTGVVAGSYINSNITVDATGRITAASGGATTVSTVNIEDSGAAQGNATTLNFNNNLTATVAGGVATINASGGGGGASPTFSKHFGDWGATLQLLQDRNPGSGTYNDVDVVNLNDFQYFTPLIDDQFTDGSLPNAPNPLYQIGGDNNAFATGNKNTTPFSLTPGQTFRLTTGIDNNGTGAQVRYSLEEYNNNIFGTGSGNLAAFVINPTYLGLDNGVLGSLYQNVDLGVIDLSGGPIEGIILGATSMGVLEIMYLGEYAFKSGNVDCFMVSNQGILDIGKGIPLLQKYS